MNVKEKLVELLDRFVYDDWYSSEEIADSLIANGVTVAVRCSECIYSDMGEHEFCNQSISHEKWNGSYFECKEHDLEYCSYGKRKEE
jgi:hypothetical protein